MRAQVPKLFDRRVWSLIWESQSSHNRHPPAGAPRMANGVTAFGSQLDVKLHTLAAALPVADPRKQATVQYQAADTLERKRRPTARGRWQSGRRCTKPSAGGTRYGRLPVSWETVAKYARASKPPLNRFGMRAAGVNRAPIENAAVPVH